MFTVVTKNTIHVTLTSIVIRKWGVETVNMFHNCLCLVFKYAFS